MKKASKLAMTFSLSLIASLSAYAESNIVNRIVAVVNDDAITELELTTAIAKENKKAAKMLGDQERREVLNGLVDDMLFSQIISKAKIEVSDDEIARSIGGVLHQNQMSIDQLRTELASKGISFDEYKKDMEKQVKRIKFVNQVIGPQVKIADQDLRDYYQKHQETFRGSHSAHIAQIIIPLTNIETQADFERVRNDALSISAGAKHNSNFTSLAEKYSKGLNSASGGDLGFVDLKDLSPVVAGAVKEMAVGEVSKPIFTGNSLVIVKLISLPEISASDFDKLRDDIYAALYDERIEETLNGYLLRERQKAYIDIR